MRCVACALVVLAALLGFAGCGGSKTAEIKDDAATLPPEAQQTLQSLNSQKEQAERAMQQQMQQQMQDTQQPQSAQ